MEADRMVLIIVYHSGRYWIELEEGRISLVWFSLAGVSPTVAGVLNVSVLATEKYWLHYWAPPSEPEMPQTPAMPGLGAENSLIY